MAGTSNASLSPEALPFVRQMHDWVLQPAVMAALRTAQSEAAAKLAWQRTLEFFNKELGGK